MVITNPCDRSERKLEKSDLRTAETLFDKIHDEEVEVVEAHVGCIDLRYPHQDDLTRYQCECDTVVLEEDRGGHMHECEEAGPEDTVFTQFEKYTDPRRSFNAECYSYQYPLDGHRFNIKTRSHE